jgi:tetratricopeptide (TPR) repeat protein
MHRDWAGADADLTEALGKDPTRVDLLVLRSSARHAMGRKDEARADIDRALDLVPGYAEALVERGGMKLEAGDKAGAQADWEAVLKRAPGGDAAQSARARLEAMGVKPPE